MRTVWGASVLLSVGLLPMAAQAQSPPPAAGSGTLASAVALGPKPVTLGRPEPASPMAGSLLPVSYNPGGQPGLVVRGQIPDPLAPPPPPPPGATAVPPPGAPIGPPAGVPVGPTPGVPAIPPNPAEQFNCGVVTNPPPASSHPFLQGCENFWNKCKGACSDVTSPGRGGWFQSDHGFPGMISPVSNPFLFEDPRSLTEIRPIYIQQGTPSNNFVFHGGDIEYAGIQARLAITERFSVVLSELGAIWMEPHSGFDGFSDHVGFAEVRIGPKYTFYRCEDSGTVAAAGVNFDIPAGSNSVFQNTGTLSVEPYVSVGQTFFRTSFGSFNVLDTFGYSIATDNHRTDFLFDSVHLDYNVANLNKIYPFLELNYFYYTRAGDGPDLGFEGRDLFNFGSMGVSGNNSFTLAPGVRYKFNECIQTGLAVEFPISGHRDLIDYRVTFDVIFRF